MPIAVRPDVPTQVASGSAMLVLGAWTTRQSDTTTAYLNVADQQVLSGLVWSGQLVLVEAVL